MPNLVEIGVGGSGKYIFATSLLSPFGMPFTQGCFVPGLVEICPMVLEETNM